MCVCVCVKQCQLVYKKEKKVRVARRSVHEGEMVVDYANELNCPKFSSEEDDHEGEGSKMTSKASVLGLRRRDMHEVAA